ncbi:MAG TPA: hypothetical protein VGS79_22525 [Puia sp.]|nr:hypothetical protein [Puia sp.]
MKTSLLTLGGVGLLAAGVVIHHSGHCPLMDARAAMTRTHHDLPAVSNAQTAKTTTAIKPNTVVLTSAEDAAR